MKDRDEVFRLRKQRLRGDAGQHLVCPALQGKGGRVRDVRNGSI